MKNYRKIRYFSQEEAEDLADKLEAEARRVNMAGSHYHAEEEMEGAWIVQHTVLRNNAEARCKNGLMPHDHDEFYKEGYIYSGPKELTWHEISCSI